MRENCIQAVAQALGRPLTQGEARDIEARIRLAMKRMATEDPAGTQAMAIGERLRAAAKLAGDELVAEAALKRVRIAQTVLAHDRIERFLSDSGKRGMAQMDAIERTLVFNADGKSNFLSVESRANAVRANSLRQMVDTFDAIDDGKTTLWGLMADPAGERALVQEMFKQDSGSPVAKKGAEAWLNVAEQLRKQFNALGGEVGKLVDWALPQHHSQMKVGRAGRDAWVSDIFSKLDRSKYVNADGKAMTDVELRTFLGEVWNTIATGGANKIEPGKPSGAGMRAGRHAEPRQIHFNGPDDYLAYQAKYGEKSLFQVMVGHVGAVSRDIAMVDVYGPNPDAVFGYFRDLATKTQSEANPRRAGKIGEQAAKLDNMFDFVAGYHAPVANEWLARSFDTLRNWLVATRLGSAVITSFSDEATLYMTAHVNHLPELQVLKNELAALNPANKAELRYARRAGLALDTLVNDMNRFGQEALGAAFSSRMANTTMRISGLNALTDARRRAFGITFMDALGNMTRELDSLKALEASDHRILKSKGITEADWQVWRLAKPENWNGTNSTMLTPEAVARVTDADLAAAGLIKAGASGENVRFQAMTKLLGVVLEETDVAVIQPGLKERAAMGSGLQRGTWKGELTRSFFLFKSFPLAMMYRHWMRGAGMETAGGKAMYIGSLVAATTVLGALSMQVNEVISGRDPKNLNPFDGKAGVRNWFAAMLKGGSLGIYGDFLFSEATQHGRGALASVAGPVAGLVEEAFNLTQGNIVQWAQGKDPHFGAELVKFVKSNTPGATLWYAKAALDRLIFHQLQEMASPGYLRTMEARARKEFGQEWWWAPGDVTPQRPPDLSRAAGD